MLECPNCGHQLVQAFMPQDGVRNWVCSKECENETNMIKPIQEISRGSYGAFRRWTVPGSGKMSYTVSQYPNAHALGAEDWRCSCPAWTRNMPRMDCKHILRVHAEAGINVEAYHKFMAKYKAEAKALKITPKTVTVTIPTHTPKTEGRKFR